MFTGLVQQVGQLASVVFEGEAGRLAVDARFDETLQQGESIAVNGTCLTLVEQAGTRLVFDVLRETFDKTALRDKSSGDPLNLERALRVGDPLGGHLVSGHVDGTGTVTGIERTGRDKVLRISAPVLLPELVTKGSIAIDGVSLTLVELAAGSGQFSVHVIPHTWLHTALSALTIGMRVNLETDMIGKYVRASQKKHSPPPSVSWDALRAAGFLD